MGVVSGLTVLALYFGGDALLSLLRAPGLGPYLILIPPFVFISGVFLALNYRNSRARQFGRLSVARVTQLACYNWYTVGSGKCLDTAGESLIDVNL